MELGAVAMPSVYAKLQQIGAPQGSPALATELGAQ
jgi:hypothetical protein